MYERSIFTSRIPLCDPSCTVLKSTLIHRRESLKRLAMSTFWRTFHYDSKFSPAWSRCGIPALPLSLYLQPLAMLWSVLRIRYPGSEFFHPGSRIHGQKDSGSRIRIRIKKLTYLLPKKLFLSSRKYDPGCSSRIRILIFYPFQIPDPGVKKAPDTGSGSRIRIRNTGCGVRSS